MGFDLDLLDPQIVNQFQGDKLQQIVCGICKLVIEEPIMCNTCNTNFCMSCIKQYFYQSKKCPKECKQKYDNFIEEFIDIDDKLQEVFKNLKKKCQLKCEQYFNHKEQIIHERICGLTKCKNFKQCNGYEIYMKNNIRCCSLSCYQNIKNRTKIDKVQQQFDLEFDFDKASNNYIKQNHRIFKYKSKKRNTFENIFSNIALIGGIHEINVNIKDNDDFYLKVGFIQDKDQVQDPKAFCDYKDGYGWFSIGQLRNGSNFSGKFYGPNFRKHTYSWGYKIKCIFDMQYGKLQFYFNKENKCYENYFEKKIFKKGPWYFSMAFANAESEVKTSFEQYKEQYIIN